MSDSGQSTSTASAKIAIVTCLITVLGTVAVSFVGIVPKLRSGDAQTIDQLQKDVDSLKKKNGSQDIIVPVKKMTVNGTVRSKDGMQPLNAVEVYLIPLDSNLIGLTDDAGKFSIPGIPDGTYSVIVRASDGKSGRVLLERTVHNVDVMGTSITYGIDEE
jgi:carboxypeptidase family protein